MPQRVYRKTMKPFGGLSDTSSSLFLTDLDRHLINMSDLSLIFDLFSKGLLDIF